MDCMFGCDFMCNSNLIKRVSLTLEKMSFNTPYVASVVRNRRPIGETPGDSAINSNN